MKRSDSSGILSFLRSYALFFIPEAFIVTVSFLVMFHTIHLEESEIRQAAPLVFLNILAVTALFTAGNLLYRELTVNRPVNRIKAALEQISKGRFDVRLDSGGASRDFAEIMEYINTMAKELSGVETLKTDFISNVSHEMKTPLAVISNYGTLLQVDGLSEEERKNYALQVTESSRRLAAMVTNVLKLNRLENQKIYPNVIRMNLSEQLCECLLGFENVIDEKNIELETDISDDMMIDADPELLSLVWNNLFSNAFKFTEPGGRVSVILTGTADRAAVQVKDTGCGMSAETGAHIFDKFYQGDTSHAAQGNGLGLALVKKVIDITGGTISVESTPGSGSTFCVVLPVTTKKM